MANFVSDTFTDTAAVLLTAHTGETGATWTKHPNWTGGNGVISNANRVRANDGSVAIMYASGVPSSADYEVRCDMNVQSVTSGNTGIMGRINTSSNSWIWIGYNGTAWAYRRDAGGAVTTAAQTLTVGQTYALKLSMIGTAVKFYVDGIEKISVTESTVTAAGRAGLAFLDSTSNSTGFHFDNFQAGDPVPAFVASPLTIPANHAGNITITLTGSNTAWDGTTVFTPSGVSGVTKVSQNVTSATAATLVVTTGSSTGTLTITESVTGSAITTVTVAAASMTGSPGIGHRGTSTSTTFTGVNMLWSSDNPTFTISGGTGASIGSTTVNSNTSATATVTYGSANGILTVTDPSTLSTYDIYVANSGNFVEDSFTGTAGTVITGRTGEVGATWAAHANWSALAVLSNALRVRGDGSNNVMYASGTPSSADYEVQADMYIASHTGAAGIMGRVNTSSNSWYWARYNGTQWDLYRSDVTTVAGSSVSQTLTVGQTYRLRLAMNGTNIKLYVDDVEKFSVTDSNVTATGKAGLALIGGGSNSTGYHFDNFTAGSLTASFVAAPTAIPKSHTGNITLTLTGSNTAWDGTTVFTPSGVSGVTKVSQNVTSATAATLVVTTGSSTGTLTITESVTGSGTTTVTVGTASISASPSTGTGGTSATVTFTGTNTVWAQDNPTFTISGGTGASIGSTTVNSNTSATASVTYGTVTASLTVTDPSTSSQTSIAVTAVDKQLVVDGNSMSDGVGGSAPYSDLISTYLGNAWSISNFAVSGQTTAQMITDAATEIDTTLDEDLLCNIIAVWEGTNSLYFGATGAAAYADLVTYCQARQSAGWKVVILTVLPRSNSGTPTDFEIHRQTVNTNIRENWQTFADALVDIAADRRLGDLGDQTNTTYYPDLVHLNDAGYAIVAHYVASAVLQLAHTAEVASSGSYRYINLYGGF